MTASYPSGHALTGFVMSEYYSKKFPKISAELKALGEKIANSREITGIHFPSDTAISRQICTIIYENNLLKDEAY
jgi:membrane-associated phospholipid phosphatase